MNVIWSIKNNCLEKCYRILSAEYTTDICWQKFQYWGSINLTMQMKKQDSTEQACTVWELRFHSGEDGGGGLRFGTM
jgi:hypothetical protein